jgi:tetratricopeptide (TPR) repeat protein
MTSGTRETDDSLLRAIAEVPDAAPPVVRSPGDIVRERFVIERFAGSGGMGTVYRALDRATGRPVALKFVTREGEGDERFAREARVLADLRHPAIVQYIAHGTTAQGQSFLAMEWLDGEDLRDRLARGGLDVTQSIALVRRVAEGLGAAHSRGIVHRDVKPSNVMLAGGDTSAPKLLDFGIARFDRATASPTSPPMTRTGVVLGTVGYMSPEQATAEPAIDARADVFSLGCLLFECLTGRPAFSGAHVVAVLAKVLREDAVRLRELRPELPEALEDLVARMLAKERDVRPRDGTEVAFALAGIAGTSGLPAPQEGGPRPTALGGGEQRLLSVILADAPGGAGAFRDEVERYGGELTVLADGTRLITLSGRGGSTEQVARAASCAMAMREALPVARVVLATGRVQTTGRGLVGPVIDRAASLLSAAGRGGVRIDEVTAGLLDTRFEVRSDAGTLVLLGRREELETPRTLLGKATPFVGREKELALLEATFGECVAEPVARAVLVTAPAGVGKSRLRHELVERVRKQDDARIVAVRGDPVGAGSAFGLVRQIVRNAVGLREGSPRADQRAALEQHLRVHFEGETLAHIADFLGDLVGAPSGPDAATPPLRAARNDPRTMSDWLRRSFEQWLEAEAKLRTVLVVVEDLHWGDSASIGYLGDGLRTLADRPLMILAFARPEVHDLFPALWAGLVQEIRLPGLTRRAGERLVRACLGGHAAPDLVGRLVDRADGNAFYLEELIRKVADGPDDALPETVLVLAHSRLERLEADARRLLRAASVFGEVFWEGGVSALVGGSLADGVGDWLRSLVDREVLVRSRGSKFPEEREYAFRHGLLREAAYAALTDADRTTGHRLAGEWLERTGELDPFVLADHFGRANDPARAIPLLARAAQMALDGGSAAAPLAIAERAVASGAAGLDLGRIRMIQSTALAWRGESDPGLESAREAVRLLPRGSSDWFRAAAIVVYASSTNVDPSASLEMAQAIGAVERPAEPSGPYAQAAFLAYIALRRFGHLEAAGAIRRSFETAGDGDVPDDPRFLGYRALVFSWSAMPQNPALCLNLAREAKLAFERAADLRGLATACFALGWRLIDAGAYEAGEHEVREALAHAQRAESRTPREWATVMLGIVRGRLGAVDEAFDILGELVACGDAYVVMVARCEMGFLHLSAGDPKRAAREIESLDAVAKERGSGVVAMTLVALGDFRGALEFCERGIHSIAPFNHSRLMLARASALDALGDFEAARSFICEARTGLLNRAAFFEDPVLRAGHLALYEHARMLDLARALLGE